MSTKTISGGIASDYGDQILWIEDTEVDAKAAVIRDDSEFVPCVITKIISRDQFDSEEAYSNACDEIMEESSAVATGEFFTDNGIFYVEIDATGDEEDYDSVEYDDDVYFC